MSNEANEARTQMRDEMRDIIADGYSRAMGQTLVTQDKITVLEQLRTALDAKLRMFRSRDWVDELVTLHEEILDRMERANDLMKQHGDLHAPKQGGVAKLEVAQVHVNLRDYKKAQAALHPLFHLAEAAEPKGEPVVAMSTFVDPQPRPTYDDSDLPF